MTKKEQLLTRLDAIGNSIKESGRARALFGLGSVGIELDRLDDYSDLDFFVIAKEGQKNSFIENLDWLENILPLVYQHKNTKDGYKALYADDIYVEFAVFEEPELKEASFSEGRIVWCEEGFNKSLRIPQKKAGKPWQPESIEWALGEVITCLDVGLCRFLRGEKLSAWRFIEGHALSLLMEVLRMEKEKMDGADIFDKDRRFEDIFPEYKDLLPGWLQGYEKSPESAAAILNFVDKKYDINQAIKKHIMELIDTAQG